MRSGALIAADPGTSACWSVIERRLVGVRAQFGTKRPPVQIRPPRPRSQATCDLRRWPSRRWVTASARMGVRLQLRYAFVAERSLGEAPVAAEPGNEMAAGATGRGRLRASHADREHVIAMLKAAFVQGRLTKDELDA